MAGIKNVYKLIRKNILPKEIPAAISTPAKIMRIKIPEIANCKSHKELVKEIGGND